MQTVIADTSKGKRVWIQGTCDKYGWPVGARYSVTYEPDTIVLQLDHDNGKRKVSKGKGGIIDLCGKRVTQWAQGRTSVSVVHAREQGRLYIVRDDNS